MRTELRRAELALHRDARLFDEVTFARLCRARDYLGDCYSERVTLENAAGKACLSRFHFNRLFARVFGETPHEFVTRKRIEEAKKLLLRDTESVTKSLLPSLRLNGYRLRRRGRYYYGIAKTPSGRVSDHPSSLSIDIRNAFHRSGVALFGQ